MTRQGSAIGIKRNPEDRSRRGKNGIDTVKKA